MKLLFGLIAGLFISGLVCGCTIQFSKNNKKPGESELSTPSVGNFNDRMENLAAQLDKNAVTKDPANTYIVTSFANLDKLDESSALGRLISENLMHGLQMHKWQILEVRLTKGVDITAAGEFSLSRDVAKLKEEYKISGFVAGTYSVAEGNLTINARIIDVNTGIVISSAQAYIPVQWLPDGSYAAEGSSNSMKIVTDGIK